MPGCPVPIQECESISVDREDDYYAPFTAPSVDPYEEIPRLYIDQDGRINTYYEGTAWTYNKGADLGGDGRFEYLSLATFTEDLGFAGTQEDFIETGTTYNLVTLVCNPASSAAFRFNPSAATPFDFVGQDITCTETVSQITDVYSYNVSPTAPALLGCLALSLTDDSSINLEGADITRNEYEANVLSVPITKPELIDALTVALAALEALGLPWPGTSCQSELGIRHITGELEQGWPTVGSLAENLPAWPICTGLGAYQIPVWSDMTDVRYRWRVPNTFTGSYFKVTWDVLTEPLGWDDEIDDPDYEPPIPNDPPEPVPQVPRPGRPTRTYVEDLTWEWTGPGVVVDPATWVSGWYELDPPPEVGTRRVINIRYECYRSPYGNKPETTGEGVDLSEDMPLQRRLTSDKHSIKLPTITI